jgi:hypothetical protein
LIANLDANVSVAKSISFRSDNSARINLEVSGTESGSNVGANLYINRYSDAGALIDTALQITRSTGVTSVKQLNIAATNNTYFQFNTTNSTGAYGTFEVSGSVYGDIGYGSQLFSGGGTAFALNARDSRSLTLGTNQAARLTINSSGNVGIGTTTPTAKLEIQNTPANDWGVSVWGNTTTGQSYGGIIRGGTNSSDVAFRVNNAVNNLTYFTVNGSGNVGIGTGSPAQLLSLASSTNSNISLRNTTTNSWRGITFLNGPTDTTEYAYISYNATSGEFRYYANPAGFGGYATFYSNDSEAMRINSSRDVLIGATSSPSAYGKLIVRGANQGITIQSSVDNNYRSIYSQSGSLYFYNGSNEGYLSSGGTWVNASDISIKKDIKEIEYGINEVMALKPKWYKMIEDDLEQIGFIAQEVEEVLPELVSTSERGMKGLSYGQMTAVLVKAMQEQQKQIEELKSLINK